MEFKGTKGGWKVTSSNESNGYELPAIAIISKCEMNWDICAVWSDFDAGKANAQLIAHAPEMLEMLNKCSEFLTKVQAPKTSAIYLSNEIEQLITKATTI